MIVASYERDLGNAECLIPVVPKITPSTTPATTTSTRPETPPSPQNPRSRNDSAQPLDIPTSFILDVGSEELDGYLTLVDEFEADVGVDVVAGASWHSVVAEDPAQNTTGFEVGFLFLIERNESIEVRGTRLVVQSLCGCGLVDLVPA